MKKAKILFDLREFEKGKTTGLSRILESVLRETRERGFEICGIVDGKTDLEKARKFAKKFLRFPEKTHPLFDVALETALMTNYDFFVSIYPKFPITKKCVFFSPDLTGFSKVQKTFLATCGKVPKYAITHTDWWKNKPEALTGRRFERISFDTNYLKGAKPQKLEGIPERFILYVGNLKPHKNVKRLIGAWLNLKDKLKETWLVVAGGNKKETLHNERIIFLDNLNDGYLSYLYSKCLVFVFVSLSEGFGLPPIEASYFGAPCVLSKIEVFREIWGNAPVWADPLSTESIAKAIKRCIEEKENVSERCQRIAKELEKKNFGKEFVDVFAMDLS